MLGLRLDFLDYSHKDQIFQKCGIVGSECGLENGTFLSLGIQVNVESD